MTNGWRWLAVALVAFGGCKPAPQGVLRVLSGDNADGLHDFGLTLMGTRTTRELVVQNDSEASLTLTGFRKIRTSDAATKAGPDLDEAAPVFTLAFERAVTVPSQQIARIPMTYLPPLVAGVSSEVHEVMLELKATNAEGATFTLRGTSLAGDCDLPTSLDFGVVATGDTLTRTLVFHNARAEETTAFVGAIEGSNDFSLTPASPGGEFVIDGGASATVTFAFSPTQARDSVSTVQVRHGDGCAQAPLRLIGTGVTSAVEFVPAQVHYGFVPVGLSKVAAVKVQNRSFSAVTLSALVINDQGATTPSTVFTLVDGGASTLELPAGERELDGGITPGAVTVQLRFEPTALGSRSATLKATEGSRTLSLPLFGVGGGPDIEVTPSGTLDLGAAPLDAGTAFSGVVSVRNVGDAPSPPDTQGNLHLGSPSWELVPLGSATLSEICIGVFDPTTGCSNTLDIPPGGLIGGGVALDIPVRVMPASPGVKEWELRLFSDDLDEPVTTIIIRVEVT